MTNEKSAYFICPLGAADSDQWRRSQEVYTHIVVPALVNLGFEPERIIKCDAPGSNGTIMKEIIDHLQNDDLVIADVTDHNANVFYELSLRHAIGKPCIHLILNGQKFPFDISGLPIITYDLAPPSYVKECIGKVTKGTEAILGKGSKYISPLGVTLRLDELLQQGDVTATLLEDVNGGIADLTDSLDSGFDNVGSSIAEVWDEIAQIRQHLKSVTTIEHFDVPEDELDDLWVRLGDLIWSVRLSKAHNSVVDLLPDEQLKALVERAISVGDKCGVSTATLKGILNFNQLPL